MNEEQFWQLVSTLNRIADELQKLREVVDSLEQKFSEVR